MNRYTNLYVDGYEKVIRCDNDEVGFTAWVVVHDTTLGPALGGCRVWNYNSDDEALIDGLRLSKGMTYKNALAGLDLGGGKSVIKCDLKTVDRTLLFEEYAKFIDSLKGVYITAEDVNSTLEDMEVVKKYTQHVATVGASGNPSPFTAYGVYCGIRAAILYKLKRKNLEGLRVAIQGVGETGGRLAELLYHKGCKLFVSDINYRNIYKLQEKIPFERVGVDEIYDVECDIFAPCALGGILNSETIPRLRCSIIAGSANNQLLEEKHGTMLRLRNILYVPDYVVNAGGVINISCEIGREYDSQVAMEKTAEICSIAYEIFEIAETDNLPTNRVANSIAEGLIGGRRKKVELLLENS